MIRSFLLTSTNLSQRIRSVCACLRYLLLLICIAGSSISISATRSIAQDHLINPIREDITLGCSQDSDGPLLVKILGSGQYFQLSFQRQLRKAKRRKVSIRRRIRGMQLKSATKLKRSAKRKELVKLSALIQSLLRCRSGESAGETLSFTPQGEPSACSIVSPMPKQSAEAAQTFKATQRAFKATQRERAHPQKRVQRIIKGSACDASNSPIIQLQVYIGSTRIGSCSGTLLSPKVVLTAAHCFLNGVNRVEAITPTKRVQASSFHIHPNYTTHSTPAERHDLAVVRFMEKISSTRAEMIKENSFIIGENSIIAGFGLNHVGQSGVLNAGYMTLAHFDEQSLVSFFNYENTSSGSNTCSGDSGGPLLIKRDSQWYIAGVTSNGTLASCGAGRDIGKIDESRFVNVSEASNRAFIEKFMN